LKYIIWISLIIIFLFRFISTRPNFKNGQVLKITGQLYSEPNTSGKSISFNLSGITIFTSIDNDIHYGDRVVVTGKVENNKIINAKVIETKRSTNVFIDIRKKIIDFYNSCLTEPYSSLIAGIVIGAKSNLPRNFSNKLKSTGTSHVVVASGMNVTIVGEFILSLALLKLKRQKAVVITILFIWFYTLIAGFEAPIIRAAIMASIAFTAQALGKVGNTFRYTLLTGLIMLIIVPRWITDVGFLLSFSTTLSIILFQSKIDNLLKFIPNIIRQDFSTSLAAQIGSAPIIIYFFGNFNILSPLINTAVLWTISPVMLIGGVSGILSFVSPAIAKPVLLLSYPLLVWFVRIVTSS
jgi:ComEC/Rec2-related protein